MLLLGELPEQKPGMTLMTISLVGGDAQVPWFVNVKLPPLTLEAIGAEPLNAAVIELGTVS
jgi:hypothetical protein